MLFGNNSRDVALWAEQSGRVLGALLLQFTTRPLS